MQHQSLIADAIEAADTDKLDRLLDECTFFVSADLCLRACFCSFVLVCVRARVPCVCLCAVRLGAVQCGAVSVVFVVFMVHAHHVCVRATVRACGVHMCICLFVCEVHRTQATKPLRNKAFSTLHALSTYQMPFEWRARASL